jgi:hypothetical protein
MHRVDDVLVRRLQALVWAVVSEDDDVFGFVPRASYLRK